MNTHEEFFLNNIKLNRNYSHEDRYYRWIVEKERNHPSILVDDYGCKFIEKGDICIDVGANIGFTTTQMLSHLPKKIYCFEADPRNFNRLKKINNNTIELYNVGVGDKEGKLTFYLSDKHHQGSTFDKKTTKKFSSVGFSNSINVDVITLDSLNIEFQFLKIDVEGFENNVLLGSKKSIKNCKFIILESYDEKFDELNETLNNFGFNGMRLLVDNNYNVVESNINKSIKNYIYCPPTYIYRNKSMNLN